MRIIEIKAFSPRWTRLIGVGNAGLRCWLPMLFAGLRLLRHEKFDLVFFSTTQFFTFTLGRIWRRLRGVPYVFDMQDPWRTDYYQRPGSRPPPGGWKYRFARLVAWLRGQGVEADKPLHELRKEFGSIIAAQAGRAVTSPTSRPICG